MNTFLHHSRLAPRTLLLIACTVFGLHSVANTTDGRPVDKENSTIGSELGACPFFTLVPDVTPPTCNGFSDGTAAVLEPVDGTGPFLYQWIGGPTTREWQNVGAGTYTVIVFDMGQGAACNLDVFVNEPGPLTLFDLNGIPPTCPSLCDGQAGPTVIGGNGGYLLTWSSGETGFNPTALCSSFDLHIEDQKGCAYDTSVTYIDAPEPITASADITNVACYGDGDGAINATISGGSPPYSVTWSGPGGFSSNNQIISGLQPGTYTIDITDNHNCTASADFLVSENPELTASATATDNLCFGGNTGQIDLTVAGGAPPYAASWSGPNGFTSTDQDLSGLEAGTYEVTITDDAGCSFTLQSTVGEAGEITVALSITDLGCHNDFSGEMAASANGGTPPYTYFWNGPNAYSNTGPAVTGLAAGSYTLTVEDASGCTLNAPAIIQEPDTLSAAGITTAITCFGESDGAIDIAPNGGTPPYSFSWTGPNSFSSSNEDINGLGAGNYLLTLGDVNGCNIDTLFEVIAPSALSVGADVSQPDCSAGSFGAIDLTVSGGTAPYSYVWTGPAGYSDNSEDQGNLGAGTYHVTVADANGCTFDTSYDITPPAGITATFDITHIPCFGDSTGAIQTTVSGGNAPYSYLWLGPAGFMSTNPDLTDLQAGGYSLMVTDANACNAFFNAQVNARPKMVIGQVLVAPTCFGATDGSIDLTLSGGTPPYDVAWTGPNGFSAATQDIAGLEAGTYTANITDANSCPTAREFTLDEPDELTASAALTHILCNGEESGAIDLEISGGTPGYNHVWSGPNGFSTTALDISNLDAGIYNIEISDANGCTFVDSFEILEPDTLNPNLLVENVSCFGMADGTLSLSVTGGTAPVSVVWSGPNGFSETAFSLSDLVPGIYSAEITDDNGCTVEINQEITEPSELNANSSHTDITCHGANDGTASTSVAGGTPPYSLLWSGPGGFTSGSANLTDLVPGSYTVLITDDNGCNVEDTVDIIEPEPLSLLVEATDPDCLLDNGQISATVSGGTAAGGYTYAWTDGAGNDLGSDTAIANLGTGTYHLTVSDDNGCSIAQSVVLVRNTLNVSASVNPTTCPGSSDGSIQAGASNGVEPYTYMWTGPAAFTASGPDITGLAPGAYTLTISDAAGCEIQLVYDVTAPIGIGFNPTSGNENCTDQADGSIALHPTGGNPGYTAQWSGPDSFSATGMSLSALAPGNYTVELTDSNGCTADTVIAILPAAAITYDTSLTNPLCAGEPTGEIELNETGSTSPYTYQWSGPNGYSSDQNAITDLSAGAYIVDITDSNGCTLRDTLELTSPESIAASIVSTPSNCQQSDGALFASATGGTGSLTFSWSDSDGNHLADGDTLENLSSGLYILTVTDSVGCSIAEMTTVTDEAGAVTGVVSDATCHGSMDGSIDITVNNGTAPYSYAWSDTAGVISGDEDLSGIASGYYAVLVTDDNGCTYAADFEVASAELIMAKAVISPVGCLGNDGSIDLTISGGTAPYDVTWTGPNSNTWTDTDIADLSPGIYHLVVSDSNGCSHEQDFEVTATPALAISANLTQPLCATDNTGEISTEISGGTPPYSTFWTGPNGFVSSATDLAQLEAGAYVLSVNDQLGCVLDTTLEIVAPPEYFVEFFITNPDCNTANGEIHAGISGGMNGDAYSYSWTDENNTVIDLDSALTDVGAGEYHLTVINVNGCEHSEVVALSNPGGDITEETINETCAGAGNGSVTLTISSVTAPYTVSWTGPNGFGSNEENLTGLFSGLYHYTITGAGGCMYFGEVEIEGTTAISASFTTTGVCFDQTDGIISTTLGGGTPPYVLVWSGPSGFSSVEADLTGLAGGLYTLSVEDDAGCTGQFNVIVPESQPIETSASTSNISCYGESNGQIDMQITGGLSPIALNWTGPGGFTSTDTSLTDLGPGTYTIHLTDSLGCSDTTAFDIAEPDAIAVAVQKVSPGCVGEGEKGSISVYPTGGNGGYFIAWTGPGGFSSTEFDLFSLDAGTYLYTVNDSMGCSANGGITLYDVTPLYTAVDQEDISCHGAANGGLSASSMGGLPPYEYTWSGPNGFTSADSVLTELEAGNYFLTVRDSAGCSSETEVTLADPELLVASAQVVSDASCSTSSDGSVTAVGAGGSEPYNFAWYDDGILISDSAEASNLSPGNYTLVLSDAHGCTDTAEAELSFVFEMVAYAGPDLSICESPEPLTVQGTAPNADAFVWTMAGDTVSTSDTLVLHSLQPGTAEVVFTASNAICTASDTLMIIVIPAPVVDAGSDVEVFAEELFNLGGNPTGPNGSLYQWFPGALGGFDPSAANPTGFLNESTEFTLTVEGPDGCTATDTVWVIVLPELVITSGFTPNGDGTNDTWIINNIDLFTGCEVRVYSRWGILVYEATSYESSTAWDGTYNGKDVPIGTYYYTIELNDPRFPEPLTGPLTIQR